MNLTDIEIQQIWEKATPIDGVDPDQVRFDFKGNKIVRSAYGVDRDTVGQWEAHHVIRQNDGGSDNASPCGQRRR